MLKAPVEILEALSIETCSWLTTFAEQNPAAFLNEGQAISVFKDKTLPKTSSHFLNSLSFLTTKYV